MDAHHVFSLQTLVLGLLAMLESFLYVCIALRTRIPHFNSIFDLLVINNNRFSVWPRAETDLAQSCWALFICTAFHKRRLPQPTSISDWKIDRSLRAFSSSPFGPERSMQATFMPVIIIALPLGTRRGDLVALHRYQLFVCLAEDHWRSQF